LDPKYQVLLAKNRLCVGRQRARYKIW